MQGDPRLRRGGLAGADVAIEDAAPEAEALAQLLLSEGAAVRVVGRAELDRDPRADAAFLDSWTPEVAPRVAALRAAGALVTSLAGLILARAGDRSVGVTGTAGKTSATAFTAHLLRGAGVDAAVPAPGLSGNLWPEGSLIPELERERTLIFELTSSHLAFCDSSPRVAVVTAFWPDHVELHGSLEAYARAKETIVRDQPQDGVLVAPAGYSGERFVRAAKGGVVRFALDRELHEGAFVREGALVVRSAGDEHVLCAVADLPVRGQPVANVLAACLAAVAAGAAPAALATPLSSLQLPPHRVVEVGRPAGVPVVDATMAATPAKGAAALVAFPRASVVLVAGGAVESSAGPVHATAAEQELLERACADARRVARSVVLFGSAAQVLGPLLPGAMVEDDIEDAVERALTVLDGAAAVVVAPMFPVSPADRARVAEVVRRPR